jgi:O-antigen/teichoic acid export membrane protein
MQPANQVLVGTVSGLIDTEHGVVRAFSIIRKALLAMTGLGIVMLLGTWLLGDLIVPFVLGPAFADSVPILNVMAILFPFAAVAQVIATYVLVPFRRDYLLPIVTASASVVTLVLIFGLGPTYAGVGVAWARVVGQIVTVGLLLFALHRSQLSKGLLQPRTS